MTIKHELHELERIKTNASQLAIASSGCACAPLWLPESALRVAKDAKAQRKRT